MPLVSRKDLSHLKSPSPLLSFLKSFGGCVRRCLVRFRTRSVAALTPALDTPTGIFSRCLPNLAKHRFLIQCGGIDVLGGIVTLMILAYVTYGLRVWVRLGKTWASEDWVMTFATVSDVTDGRHPFHGLRLTSSAPRSPSPSSQSVAFLLPSTASACTPSTSKNRETNVTRHSA